MTASTSLILPWCLLCRVFVSLVFPFFYLLSSLLYSRFTTCFVFAISYKKLLLLLFFFFSNFILLYQEESSYRLNIFYFLSTRLFPTITLTRFSYSFVEFLFRFLSCSLNKLLDLYLKSITLFLYCDFSIINCYGI